MEVYQVIGLREHREEAAKEFHRLADLENPPEEITEIRKGYFNPLIVSRIINAKLRCYLELLERGKKKC